jgi:hypothetical protein
LGHVLASESDRARARNDPTFRHRLLAESLERLLGELVKLRAGAVSKSQARQIGEGGALAVQLAELLQKLELQDSQGSDTQAGDVQAAEAQAGEGQVVGRQAAGTATAVAGPAA